MRHNEIKFLSRVIFKNQGGVHGSLVYLCHNQQLANQSPVSWVSQDLEANIHSGSQSLEPGSVLRLG